MERPEAAEMLYTAGRAHRRARRARQAFWFPLVLFGTITLASTPLYRANAAPGWHVIARPLGPASLSAGAYLLANPALVSLFWLIALPLGYVATVAYYRHRARRQGIASPVRAYVLVGLALLALLALILASIPLAGRLVLPGDLVVRGLTPLLTIALGLVVLAWTERSGPLGIFAACFLGLALVANLYDIANVFSWIGVRVPDLAINVIVPGAVLTIAGVTFRAFGRRAR